ncbi:amidohydrolase family protein [Streptomyces sp. NRRL F-5126]|uniref:amidohydrolase family protein n=1 Tax=Streptomyces sp. NRRL F-5126 TaxID=1463857 RepID=UPI0004CC77CA|nr:amidohydrolase family protein [Streptomyces sp. NRRL F-5126]
MPPSRPQPSDGDPAGAAALVLTSARLADGRIVDVRLNGGRIEAVGTAGSLDGGAPMDMACARVDLGGYLLMPAPVETHAHADTALSADGPPPRYTVEDVRRRATEAVLVHLGHGVTAVRSHVRVGDGFGSARLEALLLARRSLRGLCDLTTVAVPRLLTGAAGAEGLAALRDAMAMGADAVGGCPDLDPDPAAYAEAVLGLASEYGRPVDLHTDGKDPAHLIRLAAMARGLRTGVSVGPCAGLALLPPEAAARAAEALAAAGVGVTCLPQGGCGDATIRACAPVRLLRAAGVRLAAGGGALRDASNPVGRGDPLEAAYLLASQCGLRPAEALAAVGSAGRAALGLPEVRVEAGFPAELLAVRGHSLAAVLSQAYSRIVVHRGRVVARTSAVREYCDSDSEAGAALPRQGRPG